MGLSLVSTVADKHNEISQNMIVLLFWLNINGLYGFCYQDYMLSPDVLITGFIFTFAGPVPKSIVQCSLFTYKG